MEDVSAIVEGKVRARLRVYMWGQVKKHVVLPSGRNAVHAQVITPVGDQVGDQVYRQIHRRRRKWWM